jgi:hypothetical protein
MASALHSVEYWQQKAEEARVRGEAMKDPGARETMFTIARFYEAQAQRLARLSDPNRTGKLL